MSFNCHKCGKELTLSPGSVVGRTEECPHCRTDMHVCLNCRHHDTAAYNECREPQAERVVEKNRGNFCDYFSFAEGPRGTRAGDDKEKAKKALDDLFK